MLLKTSPLIRQALKDNVLGYLFDIKTGKLEEVPFKFAYDG